MLARSSSQPEDRYRMLSGHCPDAQCRTKLFFPSYDSSIECTGCGQRHERAALQEVQEVTDPEVALHNMVRNLLVGSSVPKQTPDSVKVLGLSNYHCKLLSPLLTHYGMDKQGQARPLAELGRPEVFDCSLLSDRAFLLQPEHVGIMGYGRDQTGSARYLADTLQCIQKLNAGQEVLIPIHADGDGHCLVHGISRALVGRELFWHALRTNLKAHFLANLALYKEQFREFLTDSEWVQIIAESDPDYLPSETEAFGLQNIHIFGLANVLHRPIILLDSMRGLQNPGDYSGVFLPAFVPSQDCCGKDGSLNKPLCIAWSSSGRNHFIALVGIRGQPLPRLPRWMLKVWGTPRELIDSYIEFDADEMCIVGGERSLQDKYVQKLAAAMEEVFVDKYHLHPAVVADVHHYIYKRTGVVGVHQNIVIENTRYAVENAQLFRCLLCGALSQIQRSPPPPAAWLQPGGQLYDLVRSLHGALHTGKVYTFPQHEMKFVYDSVKDELIPDQTSVSPTQCAWCQGKQLRQIRSDGSVVYYNGDRTSTPAAQTKCNCGYKHYWNGQEYDNNPAIFSVPLKWKGQSYEEEVLWFQEESNPELNSNAYAIATALVQKHFPAEFGSEKLVQQVVETILQNTAAEQEEFQPISLKDMPSTSSSDQSGVSTKSPSHRGTTPSKAGGHALRPSSKQTSPPCPKTSPRVGTPWEKKAITQDDSPSKIILTGTEGKTLHKEELGMSEAERGVLRRIREKAAVTQQRHHSVTVSKQQQGLASHSNASSTSTIARPDSSHGSSSVPDADKDLAGDTAAKKPQQKRIRLTSSDGKQATLALDPSTTYSELQTRIEAELHIPFAKQRIRYGFPPKELAPPDGDQANQPVPLQNGDKVTVEVISSKAPSMDRAPSDTEQHSLSSVPGSSTFSEGKRQFTSRDDILRGMERLQKETAGDKLDLQLCSLTLMATLTNTDVWAYVQQKAPLFEKGGLFYAIVERDLGLVDGKHFMLPSIPNKKFTYNAMEDRLELCLEPIGHFPVRPGVDSADSQTTPNTTSGPEGNEDMDSSRAIPGRPEEGFASSSPSKLKAGGSGVVSSGGERIRGSYRAFSGHAHTLASGSMADQSTADHTMAGHCAAEHTMAGHCAAEHDMAGQGGADHSMSDHSRADHSMAEHSRADHSMSDHRRADHSMAEHSTADHSMSDHSRADYSQPGHAFGTDTPHLAQFQREINQMLEEKERKVAMGHAASEAAQALTAPSQPQGTVGPRTAGGQTPDSAGCSQEGVMLAQAACDVVGTCRTQGTEEPSGMHTDTAHPDAFKDQSQAAKQVEEASTDQVDTLMDVDEEGPPRPSKSSSPLPMEVESAGNVADEGGGSLPMPVPSAQHTPDCPAEKPSPLSPEETSPVYVARRLGPGYSILIQQHSQEPSDPQQTDPQN